MNQKRRQEIRRLLDRLAEIELIVGDIKEGLEAVRDEEQDYRNAMPDSIADGEKGLQADAAIAALDDLIDTLDSMAQADVSAVESECGL